MHGAPNSGFVKNETQQHKDPNIFSTSTFCVIFVYRYTNLFEPFLCI